MKTYMFQLFMCIFSTLPAMAATNDIVEGDRALVIQNQSVDALQSDYKVQSFNQPIAGKFKAGFQPAQDSWDAACTEWMSSVKENLSPEKPLHLSCGVSKTDESQKEKTGMTRVTSEGSYQVRVRIRDPKTKN